MAKKKEVKPKEPVVLRTRELKNGGYTLYLDCYKDGHRSYDYLKLYLVPERTELDKEQNRQTMEAALRMKAQRIMEITSGQAGIVKPKRSRIYLSEWMETYATAKAKEKQGASFARQLRSAILHLELYAGKKVTLDQVNDTFCYGFLDYLKTAKTTRNRTNPENGQVEPVPLSSTTARGYAIVFGAALEEALHQKFITSNPMHGLNRGSLPTIAESERAHLTTAEIQKLIDATCSYEQVKRAFLFSCFCGLRLSDVRNLTWGNLKPGENGELFAELRMQKTQHRLTLPIGEEAQRWLPDRGDSESKDHIFALPKSHQTITDALKGWAEQAKIDKEVTFHVSRHTFATLMLSLGADIYTTSKLLGHTKVETTQIYAKIVDEEKVKAVNLTAGLFSKKEELSEEAMEKQRSEFLGPKEDK